MNADEVQREGPDFRLGVNLSTIPDGAMVDGHVGDQAVLLVRRGNELFAVGATCPHYGGPMGHGLVVGETIRCPWHHACFSLRSGAVLRAPALDALPCWTVEVRDGVAYVRDWIQEQPGAAGRLAATPDSIVIIGGGAAGNAAAETLRGEGYAGPVTMLSADAALPCDRPNLSKDYLAGKAPEDWALLRPASFYEAKEIDVRLNARVVRIDTVDRRIELATGEQLRYGALLMATGAEPVRLKIPGADLAHVHYLRTLDDSRALVAKAEDSRKAVIIGASFIGLEVASSLSARGIQVHVVGPENIPMERVLGPQLGSFIRSLHEQHGVFFHLGQTAVAIDAHAVTLDSGERIETDLVVIGIGVRPAIALAEEAGLTIDRGVVVDQYLETSAPGVFAAGDIARWPDARSGESIRVEHFVVAERQGQTAARNMLGCREPFDAVPFFWTEQHGLGIAYVGHAEKWDEIVIDGSIEARDCTISYLSNGRKQAVAVIHRDLEGLCAEVEFEREMGRPNAPSDASRLMASEPEPAPVCEVVGVFHTPENLETAIDELLRSGFHRAELSLLASEEAVAKKLSHHYRPADEMADDPAVPRAAFVSTAAIGDAEGGLIGGLTYVGAVVAVGAVVMSGGTLAATIAAAVLAGGTGGLIGSALARWVGHHHADHLQRQIGNGGLLLWVRAWNESDEARALEVMGKHAADKVHAHGLCAEPV